MKKIVIILATYFYFISHTCHASDYNYDVTGHGDNGYYYGEIDANSNSRDVEGYIYDEDGNQKYFTGEWSGHGEVEGYDEDGSFIQLEVD